MDRGRWLDCNALTSQQQGEGRNAMPAVSIVMPVYFEERGRLRRAVQSVLDQAVDLELHLVADDGLDYSPLLSDARIRHHRTGGVGRGPSAARNLGLSQCRGEWVAFLDSDDYFSAHKLERLIPLARQHGLALDNHRVVFSDGSAAPASMVAADTPSGLQDLDFCLAINNPLWPVFDRRCIGPARFLEDLRFSEDSLFNLSVIAQNNGHAGFLNEALHHYVVRPDSLSRRGPVGDVAEQSYLRILQALNSAPLPLGTRRTLCDFYAQRIATNRAFVQWAGQAGHAHLSFQTFVIQNEQQSSALAG
jgi:glycosyltransferase involved in cell wall biosynthesis